MFLIAVSLMAIGILVFIGTLTEKVKQQNPPEKIKQMRIGGAVLFVVGAILTAMFPGETRENCPLNIGNEYVLKVKDTMLPVPVATKPEYLDLHLRVLRNDDTLTLEEKQKDTLLLKNKQIVVVQPGTKVKLEDLGIQTSKVLIKEGKYAGNLVYTRNDFIRCEGKSVRNEE